MAFYPGQQVVCVNARIIPGANNWYIHMLEEKKVYTIREVVEHAKYTPIGYGVRLESIWLPKCDVTQSEETWHPERFRPCVKTNISVFTEMLTKIPERADA
jgi:hypothetical protein